MLPFNSEVYVVNCTIKDGSGCQRKQDVYIAAAAAILLQSLQCSPAVVGVQQRSIEFWSLGASLVLIDDLLDFMSSLHWWRLVAAQEIEIITHTYRLLIIYSDHYIIKIVDLKT